MINSGYRILSLEASDVFKHEINNSKEIGYILPDKKKEESKYYEFFKNVLDDSLELRELEKYYLKKCRREFCFEDKDSNKYTLAVVNLKFNYVYKENDKTIKSCKELREYFYSKGFNLNNTHYVRYKRSSGSSRDGNCLFIDEKLIKHMEKWGECGLKFKGEDLASWEAYKALSISSIIGTVKIPLNGILFIPDSKSLFREEVVSVEEDGGKLKAEMKETEIKNTIWDGESLLDESLFVDKYKDKHMLLLRNKYFKSCGFKTKLQKWFIDKKITLESLKEKGFVTLASDIKQIVMVTTPSSMKFLKFMGNKLNEKNVQKWIEEIDDNFGVVKYDKRTRYFDGCLVRSSYQFINTLDLKEEEIKQLLNPSIEYIKTVRNDIDFMRFHFNYAYKKEEVSDKNETTEDENRSIIERNEVIFKLMNINNEFAKTKLYYDFRNDFVQDQKEQLKQGHVLLNGTNATLFGNGPEFLMALSGEYDLNRKQNESMILNSNEIYCKHFKDGEKLVCARSPHITMGNLYCVTNNLNNTIWEYFDLGTNIVCVNAINENIQQRLNGCDYDSDSMLITNDKIILKSAFNNKDKFKVPVCNIESSSKEVPLFELDYNTSENKIGEIVNLSQRLNSYLWNEINDGKDFVEVKEIYEDICKLAVLSGIEIDKAKRAYSSVNVSQELKSLKDKYNLINPQFFEKIDEVWIESEVSKIKDIDKNIQQQKRGEKRKELKSKKEYKFYKTSMEYLYKYVVENVNFKKSKPKELEYIPISDMLIKIKSIATSTQYDQVEKAININEAYLNEIKLLYESIRTNNFDDEKDSIYNTIEDKKRERDQELNKYLKDKKVVELWLKKYEKNQITDWRLYAPLLESETFKEMLKESKEKMKFIEKNNNGEFELFSMKFTKK